MFIVYTEILGDTIQRWYYGTYADNNRANEVALELGGAYPVYHCVCSIDDAQDLGILNMPKA